MIIFNAGQNIRKDTHVSAAGIAPPRFAVLLVSRGKIMWPLSYRHGVICNKGDKFLSKSNFEALHEIETLLERCDFCVGGTYPKVANNMDIDLYQKFSLIYASEKEKGKKKKKQPK